MEKPITNNGIQVDRLVFPARLAGFTLGGIAFLPHILLQDNSILLWIFFAFSMLIWPAVATVRTTVSAQPLITEGHNMMLDSLLIGFWLPVIGFSPITCTVGIAMTLSANITIFGPRLLPMTCLTMMMGTGIGCLSYPPTLNLALNWPIVISLIPLSLVFPLIVASVTYRITQQLQKKREQLLLLSQHDSLTKLLSRDHWHSSAQSLLELSERQQQPAAIMLADIDHFKKVNDTYGHKAGDATLQQVAAVIRNSLQRQSDMPGDTAAKSLPFSYQTPT